jgi:hypothetical protein
MALEVGQVFAGYTILRVLGSGGMGRVDLASHPRLPTEVTADPQRRERKPACTPAMDFDETFTRTGD